MSKQKETRTPLARFKSPTKEFELSWNPNTDVNLAYPIKDELNKPLANHISSLSKRPVVIIIGWIGSSPQYLKRYIHFYNSLQLDAIWFCPPSTNHFNPTWMREYAKRLLEFLNSINYDRPTIFHAFSGNCVCLSQILDLIATDKRFNYLRSLIIGQVYDSSPGEISTEGAIMSLTGASDSKVWYSLVYCVMKIYEIMVDVPTINKDYLKRMEHATICPTMFIYCKDDKLIPWQQVESFISKFKAAKVEVDTLSWDHSKHVNHITAHKEEYTSRLRNFIEKCVKKTPKAKL